METMTVSEIMDIMEELGICVDSFTDDIYIPTLEELCRMFGVNSLEDVYKRQELFNHSSVSITKRYLGLRQEELLNTYDCLSF